LVILRWSLEIMTRHDCFTSNKKQHVYGSEAKNTDLALSLHNLGYLEMEHGNYDKTWLN
jgi:hypothetical protein